MAQALAENDPDQEAILLLMADAVRCGIAGQKTPDGHGNLERMLHHSIAAEGNHGCGRAGPWGQLRDPMVRSIWSLSNRTGTSKAKSAVTSLDQADNRAGRLAMPSLPPAALRVSPVWRDW